MDVSGENQPLSLSIDAALDRAVDAGWTTWQAAARARSTESGARWLVQRLAGVLPEDDAGDLLSQLTGDAPPDERALAAAELAELAEEDDPALAAMLWEAVLDAGRELDDGELFFEGASRLAALEEPWGDPLTAAEFLIAFLNWRRQDGHGSDPETVLTAFDEIVRLAELDGASAAAARFAFEQARFMRVVEAEMPAVEIGDWAGGMPPFASWETA
jgi:hypothetical protein